MSEIPKIDIGTLVQEWVDGRFKMRGGFYALRGPLECDLNSKILEMFYFGLKKDVSPEAATNFVRFVNKLQDLSATSFIVTFERFWSTGCVVIGGGRMDESSVDHASKCIKRAFIEAHQSEIPADEVEKVEKEELTGYWSVG